MLYNLEDTIAAVTTPRGTGATGIIRVCGPAAVSITDKFFFPTGKKRLSEIPTHTIIHGWIKTSSGTPVDEVLVSLMLKPRTYTGEDTVEISAHAGPAVLDRIVELAVENGARLAGPGEFTFRAYVNGKMDLAEAEAVAELVSSRTGMALEAALSHLTGRYSAKIREFRGKLISLLALYEAALDHCEEDIEFISRKEAEASVRVLIENISGLLRSSRKALFLREGFKVAIIGRPNAGKSSLLNALLERERAIVTDIPGTTRDVLEETIEVKGLPLVLMDTAGLTAHAADQVEKIGLSRTLEAVKQAQAVVWVLDSSSPEIGPEKHIAALVEPEIRGKTVLPVWNKSDLPFRAPVEPAMSLCRFSGPAGGIKVSALNGSGIDELEAALLAAFAVPEGLLAGTVTANLRHIDALGRAENALNETLISMDKGFSEEVQAMHIKEALGALGEITGETATEEILADIFKNFCIGK